MKHPRTLCRALCIALLLPGILCLAALFVPPLHGTDFSAFAARDWWILLVSGGLLSLIGLVACQFVRRA